MTTMRDVALRAGVSLPTVSYVVNGGPRPVSAATRTKVLMAIEELGYKPNQLAKGLAKKITRAIALIIPNSSDLFFARMAHAVEEAAYSAGFNLFLCNSGQDLERELSYFPSLKEKHIDGILLVTCGISSKQLQQVIEGSLPIVILDREIEHVYLDTVVFDNYSAGKQATEHLLHHGHNRIACLAGPRHLLGAMQRVEGYQEALRQAGITPDETLVKWSDYTFDGGLRACSELLNKKGHPTAIVACNDEMGVSAIHAAQKAGLEVPTGLAIVGMGNSFVGQVAIPQLTTIFASVDEMGKLGTEILLEKINGTASLSTSRQVLETRLVVRESCGCTPRKG